MDQIIKVKVVKRSPLKTTLILNKNIALFDKMPSIEDHPEWTDEQKKKIRKSGRAFDRNQEIPDGSYWFKVGNLIKLTNLPTGVKVKSLRVGKNEKGFEFYLDEVK